MWEIRFKNTDLIFSIFLGSKFTRLTSSAREIISDILHSFRPSKREASSLVLPEGININEPFALLNSIFILVVKTG